MKNFTGKWILYCATGEILGISAAGLIAAGVNHWIGEPHTLVEKLIVLVTMTGAGCIEGSLLGLFQWRVLRQAIPTLPAREWVGYTVLVAAIGWFLGMLPSLFLMDSSQASTDNSQVHPLVFLLLCLAMGLGVGSIFGLFQWFSLKKYLPNAFTWIYANAIGWGLGLGWIYLAASLPTAESSVLTIILLGFTGGMLAGTTVGMVTGLFLKRLLQ